MMPRLAVMVTRFASCEVVEEIDDPQEHAGDDFALVEEEGCIDPLGHLFKTECGATRCVHCGCVAWS